MPLYNVAQFIYHSLYPTNLLFITYVVTEQSSGHRPTP